MVAQVHGGRLRPARGEAGGTRAVGRAGEDVAVRYLLDLGWRVLDRNWRCGAPVRGELDVVALEPATRGRAPVLVAVEVKTRRSLVAGPPAAGVDARKLARLRRLASAWVRRHPGRYRGPRVDVVSVLVRGGGPAQVRHHRGVGGWESPSVGGWEQ